MTWSRLRPGKADELKRTRRHSTINATLNQNNSNAPSFAPQKTDIQPVQSPSPLRRSFDPTAEKDTTFPANDLLSSAPLEPPPRHRFSLLAKRHVSDPQLSRTARDQADVVSPPLPTVAPSITVDNFESSHLPTALSNSPKLSLPPDPARQLKAHSSRKSLRERRQDNEHDSVESGLASSKARESRITFDEPDKARGLNSPPAYGDESNSSLALPVSRLSESSKSDGSLGDPVFATTTTQTVSTTTTFFRLPRRKKNKGPLFPLPVKIPPTGPSLTVGATSSPSAPEHRGGPHSGSSPSRKQPLRETESNGYPSPLPSPGHLDASIRRDSTNSAQSGSTSPLPFGKRGQSKQSLQQNVDEESIPTPTLPQSSRTSTSTGRPSLGGLFNIARLRHNSEPHQPRHSGNHPPLPATPISAGSKSHSFTIHREPLALPDRVEGDTPAKYLMRLEDVVSRGVTATVLSRSNDEFFLNVLRSYMRGFKFFGEPLDICIRKYLMVAELPKETQQIDRVIQALANRYHECNPGVFESPDHTHIVAFSILMLHTDVFNKNNKNKMQKPDYIRNTRGQGVAEEILECFYDNISYTPFIYVEDDLDLNTERTATTKRKNLFTKQSTDAAGRPSREPVDPYNLLIDNRLDTLRPSLKEVMNLENHYTYHGTGSPCNFGHLYKSFFNYGVLQILSSRSRPDAFTTPETVANPADAHPGVVDIKITKVGILWRKDTKKKKTRSPWQEWGAILTGSQLYLFRNSGWAKSLMHQHDSHSKHRSRGSPVTFKPPLEHFKPDVLMSTQDAVALRDTSYKKHKNALTFVRHGGLEEIFLADNEAELNDWLAKLNYASTYRTTGVRIRGWNGHSSETLTRHEMSRIDSDKTAQSSNSIINEPVSQEAPLDLALSQQIQTARREIMFQKINEADELLKELSKLLDMHLRNARHLQVLAPIQNRTRERIILAAGSMSAKIKWTRIEIWRSKCHRDILVKDLEDDMTKREGFPPSEGSFSEMLQTQPQNRRGSKQIEHNEGIGPTDRVAVRSEGGARPATQPSPAKPFSMHDVFESFQTVPVASNHQTKGSWELPPLAFQPSKDTPSSDKFQGPAISSAPKDSVPNESSQSINESLEVTEVSDGVVRMATPATNDENHEQEALRDAGILEPDSPTTKLKKRPETPTPSQDGDSAKYRTPDIESGEGRNKVRRSLQRTLRDSTHGSSHHRSRRGKESSSSAGLGDTVPFKTDAEGLARSTGSFTVHGKKASVVNLGSEWQNISRNELLKGRKDGLDDGSKLLVPSAIQDENSSTRSVSNQSQRPISAISASTTTTSTAPFQEASEDPMQDMGSTNDSRRTSEMIQV